MTLKRQLLLVSLLALLLPWAGCEFIRETESALRQGLQQQLTGTARALANALSAYDEEYPGRKAAGLPGEQIFVHALGKAPEVDGFFDDWLLGTKSLRVLRGPEGPVRIAAGSYERMTYIFVDVSDKTVIYSTPEQFTNPNQSASFSDRIDLISSNPPEPEKRFSFTAEAPGAIVSYRSSGDEPVAETAIGAHWQDVPGGYRLEARIPSGLLGTHVGLVVQNTNDANDPPTRISNFSRRSPEPIAQTSERLFDIAEQLLEPGTRVIVTDAAGWRLVEAGSLGTANTQTPAAGGWSIRIYDLLVEDGRSAGSAEPDPSGREQLPYVHSALGGKEMPSWFRGDEDGRAIVAVATPIRSNGEIIGALILQQGTDAILSATNASLARLINLTLIVTVLVAGTLIGYASWLSRRIRHLSLAAEAALENETLQTSLPSALAVDEIGDLSRSFSYVLRQLDDYNAYLRSLASKLSHELRTPLAIVTSSLENLEHESLSESSANYTARAREGADRLRRILVAMSEASRVEELMNNAEPETFDLRAVLQSTVAAYRDVYRNRQFSFSPDDDDARMSGSPELIIQMLDKLVDNAVDFSADNDTIKISLSQRSGALFLGVSNPGPPLPDSMRSRMFDSMVSVRNGQETRHLGLGLYVARLIAEGHGGKITADNIDGGVRFEVQFAAYDSK